MACSPFVSFALSSALLVLADIPAAPVLSVMTFALVITVMGHINKNYRIVAVGLAILFLATGAMILGAYISYSDGGERDPRPCAPGTC